MGTVHTLHDAGTFLFCAGLVCWAQSHTAVVVHVNRETGQVCLPQAPCEWLHAPPSRSPGLESFTTTAERLAASQLGLQATVRGYHVLDSAQPDCHTSSSKPPFLLDTAVSESGTTKITAWFLVGNAYCAEDEEVDVERVGGWERGEDWTVEFLEEGEARGRLPRHEVAILERAEVAWVENEEGRARGRLEGLWGKLGREGVGGV